MIANRYYTRQHVARDAHLQWNVAIGQMPHQHRVLDRANAVADPLRADLERGPHRFRTRRLARMSRESQPAAARKPVDVREPMRRAARLVAADSERHHAV